MQSLALGVYDNPLKQEQAILNIDLLRNNVVVFGGLMTGKTTFLKTLLVRMHEPAFQSSTIEEEVYILDFGNSLGAYSELHSVCACFNSSNDENVKRIFKVVEEKMDNNTKVLSKRNQSFLEYCKNPTDGLHHIVFIIDNAHTFFSEESYFIYRDTLLRLCRDGISKGVTVVLTSSDTVIPNKYLTCFGKKIALQISSEKYMDIFGCKPIQPMQFKGRGLVTVDSSVLEFQCFLPFKNESLELSKFIEKSNEGKEVNPNRLISFDGDLTFENLHKYTKSEISKDALIVGLDYYQHAPIDIDLKENRVIGIYGKKHFGKTNLLNIILKYIFEHREDIFDLKSVGAKCQFILFDDGRKQLQHVQTFLSENGFEDVHYVTKSIDFKKYLPISSVSSANVPRAGSPSPASIDPTNTLFIVQNRSIFSIAERQTFMGMLNMVRQADNVNSIFIFPDVPQMDKELAMSFINNLSCAFVLDNIGGFVTNKGKGTPFENMNPKELKEDYTDCELSDGFYYDIYNDTLEKLKFIKCDYEDLNSKVK
jgi:hypothetical protein